MPGFFGRAIERLETHREAGLFSGESRLVDGVTGRPIGLRPVVRPRRGAGVVAPDAARRLLRRSDNWVVTGAAVFRADSVGRAGGFDEELGSFADGFLVRKIVLREGFYFEPAVTQTWRIYLDGVSRRRALDPVAAVEGLRLWPARIAADGAFPAWYPERFRRRWRFAAARLALDAEPVNEGVLAAMAVESRLDRAVLLRLCPRIDRRAARLVGLTWLWLRLRPGSLLPLARTALMRRTRPLTRMTR
jgi:hypothetical protein